MIYQMIKIMEHPYQVSELYKVGISNQILLPVSALAFESTSESANVKVFRTSLFPNPMTDLVHVWYEYVLVQNFTQYHPHPHT